MNQANEGSMGDPTTDSIGSSITWQDITFSAIHIAGYAIMAIAVCAIFADIVYGALFIMKVIASEALRTEVLNMGYGAVLLFSVKFMALVGIPIGLFCGGFWAARL